MLAMEVLVCTCVTIGARGDTSCRTRFRVFDKERLMSTLTTHPSTESATTNSRIDAAAGLLARYGLVVVIGWIGALKFTSFEANGIQPLVANSPMMNWLYTIFSVQTFSSLLGVVEITVALLIAIKPVAPKLSAIGSLGAIGLLMALHYRDRTGKALSLESSLLGSTLFVTSELVMRADHTPIFRFNLDRDQTGLGPLCRIYRAADEKWIALVVASPKEWKALCEVRGLEGLSRNERFVDAVARSENGVALALELEAWFAAHPAADAVAELRARSVPAELIRPSTRESFFFDAENIRAGRVSILNHPQHGELRDPCGAIRFSDMQCVVQRTAPLIGEHSRDVLSMLGFSPSETEALRAEKVVTWPKEAVNG